jgi:hypothetical protein
MISDKCVTSCHVPFAAVSMPRVYTSLSQSHGCLLLFLCTSMQSSSRLLRVFPVEVLDESLLFHMHATCLANLILVHLMTPNLIGRTANITFFPSLFLLHVSCIQLSLFFSQTVSLFSLMSVRDQIPYSLRIPR